MDNVLLDFSMNENAEKIILEPDEHITFETRLRVVLIDFSESKNLLSHHVLTEMWGNSQMRPPESENNKASPKGDVWSLGVLTLILLKTMRFENYNEEDY